MRWTDRPPEAVTLPIEAFLAGLPAGTVRERGARRLDGAGTLPRQPWVAIERRAVEEALQAIANVAEERGGLLIGRFHAPDPSALGPMTTGAPTGASSRMSTRLSTGAPAGEAIEAVPRVPPTLVHVLGAVAGAGAEATPVSLRLPAGTWDAARARLGAGDRVVGWFHSHPGLGAFFSETDRATQAAFFSLPGCLGWVIDPVRGEQAWFVGAASQELAPQRIEPL
jgi:hypothetical protein